MNNKEMPHIVTSNEESVAQLAKKFEQVQNNMRGATSLDDQKLKEYHDFSETISNLLNQMDHHIPEYEKVLEIKNGLEKEFADLAERFLNKDHN